MSVLVHISSMDSILFQEYKSAKSLPKYPTISKNGCLFMNTDLWPVVLDCNVPCWKAIIIRGEISLSILSKKESLWETINRIARHTMEEEGTIGIFVV
ncbi:hypothetical protein SAMN05421636_105296 [Pricia antarctica]|uniref:Uncharacterized protein n=1 Tax=Pricia antarctica TaxID=641691 RepID=A0A1G7DF07_9FLAO|nr:hypothetical protein SAMN05421636_105296 [Pricia antarctica]